MRKSEIHLVVPCLIDGYIPGLLARFMGMMTRGDLTCKMFRRFFDKWNQDKAHERVAYAVFVDDVFDLLH